MTRAAARETDAGLSLVEVIAAVAILAVLTSAVVVYWSAGTSPAREAADRLTLRLTEAREHVLVTGETLGFAANLDGSGWRFFRFRDGAWMVVNDHPALRPERLSADVRLYVQHGAVRPRDEEAVMDAPEVLFDPGGFDAPFIYEFRGRGDRVAVRRMDDGVLVVETTTAQSDGAA